MEAIVPTLKFVHGSDIRRLNPDAVPVVCVSALRTVARELFNFDGEVDVVLHYIDDEGENVIFCSDPELEEAIRICSDEGRKTLRILVSTAPATSAEAAPAAVAADLQDSILEVLAHSAQAAKMAQQAAAAPPTYDAAAAAAAQEAAAQEAAAQEAAKQAAMAAKKAAKEAARAQAEEEAARAQAEEAARAEAEAQLARALQLSQAQQQMANGDQVVHEHVTCDGCGASPITGVRYKCAACPDFDLCAACEERQEHEPTHAFLKVRHPCQAPAAIMTVLREDQATHDEAADATAAAIALGADSDNWRVGLPVSASLSEVQKGGRRFLRREMRRKAKAEAQAAQAQAPAPAAAAAAAPAPAPKKPKSTKPMARFVCDVTVCDGTELAPEVNFNKTWRLRNDGEVAWPEGVRLRAVGGDRMAGPAEGVAVRAAQPGEEVDITVDLVAPTMTGRYVGYWRLQTAEGTNFGHRCWVDVCVAGAVAPAAVVASPAKQMAVPVAASALVAAAAAPVAAAVAPVAPVAPVVGQWETELAMLGDMGFYDRERNVALLATENGSVQHVVAQLLRQ